MTDDFPLAQLAVDRTELLAGLRRLARIVDPRRTGEAIISFTGADFIVAVGGGEVSAPASGKWPRDARLPGSAVVALAGELPGADPVVFTAYVDRLTVGAMSIECAWQDAGAAKITAPIGAALLDLLRLTAAHSDEELIHAGLFERIEQARTTRSQIVGEAILLLAPLGIQREALERIVDAVIQETRAQRTEEGE